MVLQKTLQKNLQIRIVRKMPTNLTNNRMSLYDWFLLITI